MVAIAPCCGPSALLLDLDGTLIDSAPDIADALGDVLVQRGRDRLPVNVVRSLIGHGVPRLVERAFTETGAALPDADLAEAQAAMAERYGGQLTKHTFVLPGAAEMVDFAVSIGIKLAVVTNKPTAMAKEILDHFGIAKHLDVVIGGDSGVARKPSPEPLLLALNTMGVSVKDAWMVGDGLPDLGAARAAGIMAVAVPSDYGEPFDLLDHASIAVADMVALTTLLAFLARRVS